MKKSLKMTKLGLKTLTLKAGMKGLRDIQLTVKRFTIMPVGINITLNINYSYVFDCYANVCGHVWQQIYEDT